jgi:hypothetical protein
MRIAADARENLNRLEEASTMARYEVYGLAQSLFQSNTPRPIGPKLLYVAPTGFGIQNADGSRT